MAIISRRQYDHPALATAGGSALHASISNLYTVLGDDSMSRYKAFTAVANSSVGVIAHEFGLDFANLKVQIFTGTYPALTLVSDPIGTGWTVAATSGLASRSIDVTAPASGGPHTYAVLVSHESNATNFIPGLVSIGTQSFAGAKTFLSTVTFPTPFTLGAVSVTATGVELNYSVGVTSLIQSQLNLKAPLASPTFTGVPLSTTAAVDTNTTQIATTAYVIGQGYAKLASPTFTGTVTIPTPFTIGAVSMTATGTELNYVAGVTSAIQTQMNLKAPLASPTFTTTINMPDGSVTVPGLAFSSDADGTGTGLYRIGANNLGFAANGVKIGEYSSAGAWTLGAASSTAQNLIVNGKMAVNHNSTDGEPAISSFGTTTTSLTRVYLGGSGAGSSMQLLAFGQTADDAAKYLQIATNALSIAEFYGTAQLGMAANNSASAPGYSWKSDLDTGMYRAGTNSIGFSTNGTNVGTISSTGAWTFPLIHNLGAGNITSGRWTGTLTNTTNISGTPTFVSAHYSRVGNTITCGGYISVATTTAANTLSQLTISALPVASSFSATSDAGGVCNFLAATGTAGAAGGVNAVSSTGTIRLNWNSTQTGADLLYFSFQYEVK
jgi:hypothetical protein